MKQWFPDGGGSCKHEHPHLADLKERVGGEEVDMKGGGGWAGGVRDRQTLPKQAPMTSTTTSLNLSPGVTGRCSAFPMIMTDLLSSYQRHAPVNNYWPQSCHSLSRHCCLLEGACCIIRFNAGLDILILPVIKRCIKSLPADGVLRGFVHCMWTSDTAATDSWSSIMS